MIDPGSIVVGVDGSEHADRAVRWAAEQASLENRRLVAVAVGAVAAPAAATAVRLALCVDPGISARTWRPAGDPRAVLVDLSSRAHLVVIGSRGRGTFTSLLGSVSAAVARHAVCPVVVCRPRVATGNSRGVVVGADGTPESRPVLEFAFAQASLRGLPLTVVHVSWDVVALLDQIHARPGSRPDVPRVEELLALLSESVAGLSETYPDVAVDRKLEFGLVDDRLSPPGWSCDLVVVGRHPTTTVGRLLADSVATAVLERAGSPVAVVPVGHG